jgi:hypothetical protein
MIISYANYARYAQRKDAEMLMSGTSACPEFTVYEVDLFIHVSCCRKDDHNKPVPPPPHAPSAVLHLRASALKASFDDFESFELRPVIELSRRLQLETVLK